MSIIKNKILLVFVAALIINFSVANVVSNSTENLTLTVEDVSFNIFSLTLLAKNFLIAEKKPVKRNVIKLDKFKISLELARSLLLWRFQLDCFYLENVFVTILEDKNGEIFLFNKNISEKEINKLFGNETNKQKNAKTEFDMSIPELDIKNFNVSCFDHNSRKFLWSIDNLNLQICDFIFPPDKNNDLWEIFLSANLNKNTNCVLLFSAKCRTVPNNSFLKLKIIANKIDWQVLDMIVGSGKSLNNKPAVEKIKKTQNDDDASPFNVIFNCFSNEINRVSTVLSQKIEEEKNSDITTNFFNSISNLVFSFNWNMEISNHIFKSGNVNLKIMNSKTNVPSLIYNYFITNSPDLLIKK